jgi:hypothetical protein
LKPLHVKHVKRDGFAITGNVTQLPKSAVPVKVMNMTASDMRIANVAKRPPVRVLTLIKKKQPVPVPLAVQQLQRPVPREVSQGEGPGDGKDVQEENTEKEVS